MKKLSKLTLLVCIIIILIVTYLNWCNVKASKYQMSQSNDNLINVITTQNLLVNFDNTTWKQSTNDFVTLQNLDINENTKNQLSTTIKLKSNTNNHINLYATKNITNQNINNAYTITVIVNRYTMEGNYQIEAYSGLLNNFDDVELTPMAPFEEIEIIIFITKTKNIINPKLLFTLEFEALPVLEEY